MINKVILLGKEFRLGLGFLNRLIEGTGKDLTSIWSEISTNPAVMIPQMIYYSLVYSYERSLTQIDFTIHDVYDWIDENGGINGSFSNEFQEAFVKSMNQDVPIDESKKKVVKPKK
jgi:hypothetical protein